VVVRARDLEIDGRGAVGMVTGGRTLIFQVGKMTIGDEQVDISSAPSNSTNKNEGTK
jgi:hypothetical protein